MNSAKNNQETRPDELTGLVLSLQDYKENDGILKLALPDKIVSVYARGVMKSTSKNRRLCNPFSLVRLVYEPQYSRDMFYLIHGSVEWFGSRIHEDLLAQSVCFLLRDMILQTGINPMIYTCLQECWKAWNISQKEKACLYACLVEANVMKLAGIAPNLDGCAICGSSRQIETLVLEEGGYVCRNCRKPEWPKKEKADLLKYRALFRAKEENIPYLEGHFHYTIEDILFLADFWAYHTDTRLASAAFLQTVARMEARSSHTV